MSSIRGSLTAYGLALVIVVGGWVALKTIAPQLLNVATIDENILITVDGDASESIWQTASKITINTHGGANFSDGSTLITLRALQNNADFFVLILHLGWLIDLASSKLF